MVDSAVYPLCFVLAPIGDEGSPVRERSDTVFNYVIKPVCEPLKLKAERADHIHQSGMITTQVIQRIVEAPLVIADLTDYNANVFYELAIRHATRKPFVQIICQGMRVPFDVSGLRTIEINLQHIPSVERAKEQLKSQILEFGDLNVAVDTPLSVAIDLAALKSNQDPLQKGLADALVQLSEIRNDVVTLASSNGTTALSVQSAADEVRALVTTLFARLSGVPDPALFSSVMDATQLLSRAKSNLGTKEGTTSLARAEEVLRGVALRLMKVEDAEGASAAKESRPNKRMEPTRPRSRRRAAHS